MNFEEQIVQAVVAQFFAPQMSQMPMFNPSTNQMEVQTYFTQSGAARVASDIWAAKQQEITRLVKDKISIDEIAQAVSNKISQDIINRLTDTRMYSGYDRDKEEMRKMVKERLADEFAKRALAQMDEAEDGN